MRVTRTTDEDDVIMRFLSAAENRMENHAGRIPFDAKTGKLVTSWLRALVGDINDDGTLGGSAP